MEIIKVNDYNLARLIMWGLVDTFNNHPADWLIIETEDGAWRIETQGKIPTAETLEQARGFAVGVEYTVRKSEEWASGQQT